jgi:fructokinase
VRIISVGEILWDVIDGREFLGGAPLNFAVHARQLGHEVWLLSAVGDDHRGALALDTLRQRGIATDFIQTLPGKPTGTAEVELDHDGKPAFRIVRPAAYDFGTLYHTSPVALHSTLQLLGALPAAKRFYDVNLRDDNWTLAVVEQLSAQANVIKLSDVEAECLDAPLHADDGSGSLRDFCRRWSAQYGCATACVTLGERGCAIFHGGDYVEVPGYKVTVADTVGAGDAFAAAFLHGLSQGWDMRRVGQFANAVGALVAGRAGATPEWKIAESWPLIGENFM